MVFSACFLGMLVGLVLAYTMAFQISMFMNIRIIHVYPFQELSIALVLALVCALASTYGPTKQQTSMPAAHALRQH